MPGEDGSDSEFPRATVLLNDLAENPKGFFDHVRRYTASSASVLAFGHRGPTFESFWGHVCIVYMEVFGNSG